MCIGIPARLVERDGQAGVVELAGARRGISLALLPEARLGDYILVHAGCGLQVIDEQAAAETLQLLRGFLNEPG